MIADRLSRKEAMPAGFSEEDLRTAWMNCDDARDLFAVASMGERDAEIGRAACACAREALRALPTKSHELEAMVQAADAWFRGDGSDEALVAAHSAAYALYHSGPHDLSFAGEARGSAQAAVMSATTDPPDGEDVAMLAANAIACASKPVDRDEMRDRREEALRTLADVCRTELSCPELSSLISTS
jgi:hypothetical protein